MLGVSSKLDLRKQIELPAPADSGLEYPTRPDKPSIAVLAFENMSGDPGQEYFSDGITEEIITALSRSPWLFIIARNTTFTYKGQSVDVRRVATEPGVRFVLEGSVRPAGDRVRVTAQLIDGLTGGHVWSERYDGQTEDVFELQDAITRQVVASIQTIVQLNTIEEPVERLSRPDLTVWELTMRAWHLLYDFTPRAYAAAKTLLERALALAPESAEANMVLSLINHHWDQEPGDRDPHEPARSQHLLPLLGSRTRHYVSGSFETAIEWAERAIHRMPGWHFAHFILVASFVALGRDEQARMAARACSEVLPDLRLSALERVPLQDAGARQELRTRLHSAGFA